ncbi:MAG TPA: protoporphyrinogen oxidase [Polyangiaceae bacterium]|nr:protoporphyrinogen oxidase [Polyangiaceae bacterium]
MSGARRIVIVGGGIAGLAAARSAVLHGRKRGREVGVTVLERSSRFGGVLLTERVDGFLLDAGADSWVVAKPQATALARALGLGGELLGTRPENRRFYIGWGDRLHSVPEGLVLGVPTRIGPLVGTRLFTWRGKARMAMEPLVPARRFEGDDDESIAGFATRRLGREAAERLVAPLLGGISAGDASDLSVRAAFPQLVAMEQEYGSLVRGMLVARRARSGESPFMSLEGGTGALVDGLVARVREGGVTLRGGTPVEGLARTNGAWTVRLEGGETLEADAVLLAVPAYAAAKLVGDVDDELAGALSSIAFGSSTTVFLGYRRADVAHPLDGVGFVVPRSAGRAILACTWVSSKWEGRAPEGHVLLRVFVSGAPPDDAALVATARAELRGLMGLDAEPTMTRVFRFERSGAQMRVGHLATLRTIRHRLRDAAPGLRVAGGGYDGVGIPDCIRQGEDAGRAMIEGS